MMHIDTSDIEKISNQLDALYTALKCFIYYSEIHKQQNVDKNNIKFWNFIEFTLLYTLLINWNETFGLNKSNNHWKKITLEVTEYTDRLYRTGEYNYTSWTEYRRYINELSHSFICFPDPYHHRDQKYNFEGIKVSLEVTHAWLHELVLDNVDIVENNELDKWPITTKNHIEDLKQEIQVALKENC